MLVTNTFFNYQNIKCLFLFPNLSPSSTPLYQKYFFFSLPLHIFIFIYVFFFFFSPKKMFLFISLITNKFNIWWGIFFFSLHVSTIEGTSLSLSLNNLDFRFVLMLHVSWIAFIYLFILANWGWMIILWQKIFFWFTNDCYYFKFNVNVHKLWCFDYCTFD